MTPREAEVLRWCEGGAFLEEDGLPRLWLHATDVDTAFNVFARFEDHSIGFHLGGPEAANARLRAIYAEGEEVDGSIIPLYCRAVNPLRLPDLYTWGQWETVSALAEAGVLASEEEEEFVLAEASAEAVFAAIELAGYDAVVYSNLCEHGEPTDSIFVWRAEMLKSPFAATFERGDPRILPQNMTAKADIDSWRSIAMEIERAKERLLEVRAVAKSVPDQMQTAAFA